mmetsp:Transcript_121774/g.339172  ORF Transcript_121774/g.339172 Transcript_121774/m.339172 type:complete len:162 (+) Transcript_121774:71-556(+)|eukprot:CAMPEP_0176229932 /NCGR_PEP_ID=MMETSP0121_2-20121125/24038_1 /TAXON_ID=160619 /ORGANISM="Kryptoperidinium foliaceum, Strain CCMP 1326" /LENGTH=161 /DNA_ID=CAMNT_0017569259 /DNA_START=61 /DNA_END=546 /DNA_ORIENTATION=+
MALPMRAAAMKKVVKPAMKKVMKPAMKAAMKASMKKAMVMKKVGMKKAAMKAMVMKKKAMKAVSNVATGKLAKLVVFNGRKAKTQGGLTKADLSKNKDGKVVSKKRSANGKKAFAKSPLKKWADATKAARKALGIRGFVPVGGSTAAGKALLAKVRSILSA